MKRLVALLLVVCGSVQASACLPDVSCADTATCPPVSDDASSDAADADHIRTAEASIDGADVAALSSADGAVDQGVCGSPTDPKNCGQCGHDCTALANVRPEAPGVACRAGQCVVPASACLQGFGHCSTLADDGCEANLLDARSCGACAKACSGATPLCSTTASGAACTATCGAATSDVCSGSCVDLKSDVKNCGTCGHDCAALPNAKPGATGLECRAGQCYVPAAACAPAHAHCSSRADDGCETDLTTPDNCGRCGAACAAPTALCSTVSNPPTCASSCAGPSPDACGSKCVDLKTDPANCGGCGHDCSALPNVRPGATGIECRAGACRIPPSACTSGNAHCSATADDGCEANLSDPKTCGSCTTSCPAATPRCSTSSTPFTCTPSCAAPTPNVCGVRCVDTQTDPKNCGACGVDCSALPNVKSGASTPAIQCVRGACQLQPSACTAGFGHCSANSADGCETNLTRPESCGSCTNKCVAPLGNCSAPTCSSSCAAPTPNLCGSTCVDTKSDPANCGACARNCGSLAHVKAGAPVQCNVGGCVIPAASCAAGFGNCAAASNDTDGCETALTTTTNCGSCGHDCTALPNLRAGAAVQCSGSNCVVPPTSCAAGFANCSTAANDTDGCETPINTSANCGACGAACQNGRTCLASAGAPGGFACACPAGFLGANCDVPRFTSLGALAPVGMSGDGAVVVGMLANSPVRWTRALGSRVLPAAPGLVSPVVTAISADGNVPVGFATRTGDGLLSPVRWLTPTSMTTVRAPTSFSTTASAVNADGSGLAGQQLYPPDSTTTPSVGLWMANVTSEGTDSAYLLSPDPNFVTTWISTPRSLSADGTIVVGSYANNGAIAAAPSPGGFYTSIILGPPLDPSQGEARRTATVTTLLIPPLPGGASAAGAWDVSANGSVVTGSSLSSFGERAFVWNFGATSATSLGVPSGATYSRGHAISGDGRTIVGESDAGAFVWTSGTPQLVATMLSNAGANLSGWTLTDAIDVSSDGKTVVGAGRRAGAIEGWVAVLP